MKKEKKVWEHIGGGCYLPTMEYDDQFENIRVGKTLSIVHTSFDLHQKSYKGLTQKEKKNLLARKCVVNWNYESDF